MASARACTVVPYRKAIWLKVSPTLTVCVLIAVGVLVAKGAGVLLGEGVAIGVMVEKGDGKGVKVGFGVLAERGGGSLWKSLTPRALKTR